VFVDWGYRTERKGSSGCEPAEFVFSVLKTAPQPANRLKVCF
jgi:hypothetical protein